MRVRSSAAPMPEYEEPFAEHGQHELDAHIEAVHRQEAAADADGSA